MFSNLIESDSHREERKRKASFFIYTLAGYALLTLVAGVTSIYAYDAHLENQNLEFLSLVAPVQQPQSSPSDEPPRARTATDINRQVSERNELIARVGDSTTPPDTISAIRSTTPEIPRGPVVISSRNFDADSLNRINGPAMPNGGNGSGNRSNNIVQITESEPPPPLRTTTPTKNRIVPKGIINSQAISLPKPIYPSIARTSGVTGTVTVQILLDESGKVISARAVAGHPLLQASAVRAAYQARFSPTILGEQPVKVSGMITYNFTLQ